MGAPQAGFQLALEVSIQALAVGQYGRAEGLGIGVDHAVDQALVQALVEQVLAGLDEQVRQVAGAAVRRPGRAAPSRALAGRHVHLVRVKGHYRFFFLHPGRLFFDRLLLGHVGGDLQQQLDRVHARFGRDRLRLSTALPLAVGRRRLLGRAGGDDFVARLTPDLPQRSAGGSRA